MDVESLFYLKLGVRVCVSIFGLFGANEFDICVTVHHI